MSDLTTTITAVLTSLKTATDIAKFLRESNSSIERAEWKLKLADIITALANTRIELTELQEAISAKDKRIVELEEAFQKKSSFVRYGDAMYAKDENGKAVGVAYCLHCWETDHKHRPLVSAPGITRTNICTTCERKYTNQTTHKIGH